MNSIQIKRQTTEQGIQIKRHSCQTDVDISSSLFDDFQARGFVVLAAVSRSN